jgi:hypothetical protein
MVILKAVSSPSMDEFDDLIGTRNGTSRRQNEPDPAWQANISGLGPTCEISGKAGFERGSLPHTGADAGLGYVPAVANPRL